MHYSDTVLDKLLLKLLDKKKGLHYFVKAGEHIFTKETLKNPFSKKTYYQGLLNQKELQLNHEKVWPKWIQKQLDPMSPFYSPGNSDTVLNTTFKNWTFFCDPKHNISPQIDPNGWIIPITKEWSLDLWVKIGDTLHTRANSGIVKQTRDSQAPLVETQWKLNNLILNQQNFLDPSGEFLHNCIQCFNASEEDTEVTLLMAIRPYNIDGVCAINDLTFLSSNTLIVNKKIGLLCDKTPSNILCLSKEDSYTSIPLSQWDQILSDNCPKHQSSAFLEFQLPIKAKKTAQFNSKVITKHEQSLIPIFGNKLKKLKKTKLKYAINQLHKKDFHTEKSVFYSKWQTMIFKKYGCILNTF